MKVYHCIIVDDDEIDRLAVVSYAKRCELLHIAGVFDTAEKALTFLENNEVSIAFLDIELPGESGIALRKKAIDIPVCVFISSHSELAATTFEIDTLDFIVKPFKFDRFKAAVDRIANYMELKEKADYFEASIGGDSVYVKTGHEQIKIKLHDILYLEALKNYTILITEKKRHCVLSNLGDLLQSHSFNSFVRIHKSYAVQKLFVKKVGTTDVLMNNNSTIPIGRSFRDNLTMIL